MAKKKPLSNKEVFKIVQWEQYQASCVAGRLKKLLERMHEEGWDK